MSADAPRILVEGGPIHRRVNHVLAALVGFMIGVLPILGYATFKARDASRAAHRAIIANCQQVEIVKAGLRATLEEADRFAASSPVRSAAEKQASVTFYRDALARLKPRRCGTPG